FSGPAGCGLAGCHEPFATLTSEDVEPPRVVQVVIRRPMGGIKHFFDPFRGNGVLQVLLDSSPRPDRGKGVEEGAGLCRLIGSGLRHGVYTSSVGTSN